MDVIGRLTAMLTIIDYHTIAFLVNTLLGCYFLRNNHIVTKKLEKKKTESYTKLSLRAITLGGGDSTYERGGDARQKF